MSQPIRVYIRCRPLKDNELESELVFDPFEVEHQFKSYKFDKVFSAQSGQDEVYRAVVKPLVNDLLNGLNCTVFAYGQTGTGKTYTIEGDHTNYTESGIIPRAVEQIFESFGTRSEDHQIRVSFLEIYNEDVYDLLSPEDDMTKLRIYEDAQRKNSVKVENLVESTIEPGQAIFEVLRRGSEKRKTTATQLNAISSRSHGVFSISILRREVSQTEFRKIGKLNLVDLAGSENIGQSGALGEVAREAGKINQSLLTLNRVITALVEKQPHIPYRESKLTRILQDSLGGCSKTSMIATISPAEAHLASSLSTLEYAVRAGKITTLSEPYRHNLNNKKSRDYEREIEDLKAKYEADICRFEFKVRNEVALEFRRELEKKDKNHKDEILRLTMSHDMERESLQKFRIELEEKDKNHKDEILRLTMERESLQKTLSQATRRVTEEMLKKKQEIQVYEEMLKEKDMENENLKQELQRALQRRTPIKNLPVMDNQYLDMTFGDDEIVHVSAKKPNRKTLAERRKEASQRLEMSGKKVKLHTCEDVELSPISPPKPRVTRSRATKRKLDF